MLHLNIVFYLLSFYVSCCILFYCIQFIVFLNHFVFYCTVLCNHQFFDLFLYYQYSYYTYWKIWYDVLRSTVVFNLFSSRGLFKCIGKVGEFYEHKTCTRTFSVLRVRVVPVELSFEKVLLFFCPGNLFCLVFASRKKSLAKKPRKQEDTSTTWNTQSRRQHICSLNS